MKVVPAANLRTCVYCSEYLPTIGTRYYRRGTAWFKTQSNRQGTNAAALVKWADTYACQTCIDKIKNGIPPGQMGLWDDA